MKQNDSCSCPLCKREVTPADGLTATERLARGILGVYAEMQGKGDYDNTLPCPRCGEYSMADNVLQNALSRSFDIQVCDACGSGEAIAAADGTNKPLDTWWAVSVILGNNNR